MVVENTGWLPTYVTKKALEKKITRGVICEIELQLAPHCNPVSCAKNWSSWKGAPTNLPLQIP